MISHYEAELRLCNSILDVAQSLFTHVPAWIDSAKAINFVSKIQSKCTSHDIPSRIFGARILWPVQRVCWLTHLRSAIHVNMGRGSVLPVYTAVNSYVYREFEWEDEDYE
jgi:hypothetical protein